MRCYSHLSDDERGQIGLLKALGQSIGVIASPKSTVSRELSRNRLPSGRYSPLHAAGAYQLRRRREALIEKESLAALAVTAVVLFHYKVDFIPGGFVGVDIFFVISGYLMTTIIIGKLAKGRFSIWDFYYDRAKRIVPGLLGMCFILLAAGYFMLEPATYHHLGSTTTGALLFFSNFQFWEATGYFDPRSDVKWLLHTWSRWVEWQFYLVYPIILMGLHAVEKTRRLIVPILWSLAILSVLLCVWATTFHPASAFCLLPQRAWEMLAGGIVALQFRDSAWNYPWIVLTSGFLFIGISIFAYNYTMAWPSYGVLLPVIGTCLVISVNRADASPFKNHPNNRKMVLFYLPLALANRGHGGLFQFR